MQKIKLFFKRVLLYFVSLVIINILLFTTYSYCLSILPGKLELSVAPGEVYRGCYEISNTSEKAISVMVEVKDWDMDEEGGVTMYDTPAELDSFFKWFNIASNEITIPPNSSGKIDYEISIPKDGSGEYRKYLTFRSMPPKKEEEGFGIATQISVPLYVVVKGTEVFKAEISDVKITNTAPVEIKVRVHNSGNVHIRPTGEVVINKKGKQKPLIVMPVNTPSPGWPVLPQQSFRFTLYDKTEFKAGVYVLKAKFTYNDIVISKELSFSVDKDGKATMLNE